MDGEQCLALRIHCCFASMKNFISTLFIHAAVIYSLFSFLY